MIIKKLIFILMVCYSLNGFGQGAKIQFADHPPLFNSSDIETHGAKTQAYFEGCGLNLSSDRKNIVIAVTFVVDSNGVPQSPILLFGNDSTMFNAVVKCLNVSPNWIPATKDGVNVACQYNLAFEK